MEFDKKIADLASVWEQLLRQDPHLAGKPIQSAKVYILLKDSVLGPTWIAHVDMFAV